MFAIFQHWPTTFKDLAMIVGIASILFLELGFTTSISTTDLAKKSSDIVANADIVIRPLPVEANGIASYSSEELVRYPNRISSTPIKQSMLRSKPPAKVRTKAAPKPETIAKKPKPTLPAASKPDDPDEDIPTQRPIIASALKVSEVPGETRQTPAPVINKQPSDKRSFVAGALQKSYKWIKAISSKVF